ncbi:MAG: hypothetical protein CMJ25_09990 [Phycisphaerae bacterium]|nr:hypothetical protein [Phycisphaerae bacterium]|tara:strand:+ start:46 stop:228 length:183 start_codon:yes stop_codon:yes gene_type:complete
MGNWENMTRAERKKMVDDCFIPGVSKIIRVDSVEKEIKKDPRIKGKEAKMIRALLQGRAR